MNLWDILILAGIVLIAVLGMLGARKRKKNGCGGCCEGCSRRGGCGL